MATETSALRGAPFFAFRTPLLPFDVLEGWGAGRAAPRPEGEAAEEALVRDRALLRARLREIVDRPVVREALFVASPDLDHALQAWSRDPHGEKGARAERTLVRYVSRMAARCTPFGLFAGCSVGKVGEETRLLTEGLERYQRHARLDMYYLTGLAEAVVADPVLQRELLFRPNSSLYRAAGQLRYCEARTRAAQRSYSLVAVEVTPYLTALLERAAPGATLDALAASLVDGDVTQEDARAFVDELRVAQVLVPDFAPAVTGEEPVYDLLAQLAGHGGAQDVREGLAAAQRELERLDVEPLGVEPERYRSVAARLSALPAAVSLPKLFQVDMVKPAPRATLGADVVQALARTVHTLHSLQPARDRFERFREAFVARYETREMPLAEVLDEESGIGFESSRAVGSEPSPLLDGLPFPASTSATTAPPSGLDIYLLRRAMEAERTGAKVLELTAGDLKPFAARTRSPLPASLAVMASFGSEAGTLCFEGASGPSGAKLLGRFCHGDPALLAHVLAYLREEEEARPQAVHAEVVHLPEGRVGNVILRPVLRSHEIAFLGRSGAPEERQLRLDDLTVAVEGPRIVLRSRRLGREVVPRLTNAHNYAARSLGAYRFLCSLAQQGVAPGVAWGWGLAERAPFLPRVVVDGVTVERARWRVEKPEVEGIAQKRGAERARALAVWREARRLPRWVALTEGDNKLLGDLDNPLFTDTLLEDVAGQGSFVLQEMFPAPSALGGQGPEGRFTNELVVPFSAPAPLEPARSRGRAASLPRLLPPGSDWLYAKLYAGTGGVDTLLRALVGPLLRELSPLGLTRWFFIRYSDPDWHLRLRLQGEPQWLLSTALPRLHALASPFLQDGTVWKLQLDTYQRECERYGGAQGMLLAERVFHLDSTLVLALVEALPGDAGTDARWRLALLAMDQILEAFGFGLPARLRLAQAARARFLREFQADVAPFRHKLGERFRQERRALEDLLAGKAEGPLGEGAARVREQAPAWRALAGELHALAAAGGLEASIEVLCDSYLHMHVNRLVRSANRAHELALYDLLVRLYESRLAREKKRGSGAAG